MNKKNQMRIFSLLLALLLLLGGCAERESGKKEASSDDKSAATEAPSASPSAEPDAEPSAEPESEDSAEALLKDFNEQKELLQKKGDEANKLAEKLDESTEEQRPELMQKLIDCYGALNKCCEELLSIPERYAALSAEEQEMLEDSIEMDEENLKTLQEQALASCDTLTKELEELTRAQRVDEELAALHEKSEGQANTIAELQAQLRSADILQRRIHYALCAAVLLIVIMIVLLFVTRQKSSGSGRSGSSANDYASADTVNKLSNSINKLNTTTRDLQTKCDGLGKRIAKLETKPEAKSRPTKTKPDSEPINPPAEKTPAQPAKAEFSGKRLEVVYDYINEKNSYLRPAEKGEYLLLRDNTLDYEPDNDNCSTMDSWKVKGLLIVFRPVKNGQDLSGKEGFYQRGAVRVLPKVETRGDGNYRVVRQGEIEMDRV